MPAPDIAPALIALIVSRIPPHVARREVTAQTNFREQLDIDSLGLLSLAFEIETQLGVDMFAYAGRLAESRTVGDLIAIASEAREAAR